MKILFLIFKKNKLWVGIFLLIILFSVLFFFYRPKISFENRGSELSEAKILAKRVSEIMFVPTDELPTIATVTDPSVLQDQIFFQDAKRGDKVLIYSNARKAILYDPIAHKIITIAPVNITDEINDGNYNLRIDKQGF